MKKRLPRPEDMVSVYAVIAFMVQAWTIAVFLQQVPAWANYLTISEIAAIFAYRMGESFVECVLLLGVLVAICVSLPPRYFRDVFKVRGTMFSLTFIGLIILFWKRFAGDPGVIMADYIPMWTVGTIIASALISGLSTSLKGIPDFAEWLAEQSKVFLYILVPLSITCCILVLMRNMT